MHTHEPKEKQRASEGDTSSGPTLERLNLLQLTLQNVNCLVNGHDMVSEHKRWANIVFKLVELGLKCDMNQPGLVTLFESACNLNLIDDLERMMDPTTWNWEMHMYPGQHFFANSSGLHIAVGRANKEAVTLLLKHHPDLGKKRNLGSKKALTPVQAVDYGVPEEGAQALLIHYLEHDAVEKARRLLQKGVRVD